MEAKVGHEKSEEEKTKTVRREAKDYILLNYAGKVMKTYNQLGSAKSRAKEIDGVVIAQLYKSREVQEEGHATKFEMEGVKMCDFRNPMHKDTEYREED